MAWRTCDISVFLLSHAEAVETLIPIKSNLCRIDSPLFPGKDRLRRPGKVFVPPLRENKTPAEFIDTSALDNEITDHNRECEIIAELSRKLVEENARTEMDQDVFMRKYGSYSSKAHHGKKCRAAPELIYPTPLISIYFSSEEALSY